MLWSRRAWIVVMALGALAPGAMAGDLYQEKYRPQIHFSPPQKWMNDPNGLVYYDGEYHLFFQYHPYGNRWGPMHWGHAVSRDLVRWKNLPIALFPDRNGAIWSGSAVVDQANSAGFAEGEKPAIVAIFTQHDHLKADLGDSDAFQTQSIAFSVDRGRNWQMFDGNPVLQNPGIRDFRDPKIFWHESSRRWIMSLAVKDHVRFYSSPNLKEWTEESRFGAAWGSHDGVWECPDLIEMQVEGEDVTRYVLLVSISSGAPNGGSGTQYFVGHFDGRTFSLDADEARRMAVEPTVFPEGRIFEDFSGDLSAWQGDPSSTYEILEERTGDGVPQWILGSGREGDAGTGALRSRPFTIRRPYVNFRISGGNYPETLGLRLRVDGDVVRQSTGPHLPVRKARSWAVEDLVGQTAVIEIFDDEQRGWGILTVDDLVFADAPAEERPAPARWLDYGTDNYAGVTWSGVPPEGGRHLFIGWMSNWRYAQDVPTERWRSAMTISRELRLIRTQRGLEVHSRPVAEAASLREPGRLLERQTVDGSLTLTEGLDFGSSALEATLALDTEDARRIDLTLSNRRAERTVFTIDLAGDRYVLDRSRSGAGVPVDGCAAKCEGTERTGFLSLLEAPRRHSGDALDLRVLIDSSSVEVFVNEGETVMTAVVFPQSPYHTVTLESDRPITLAKAAIHPLTSIWEPETKDD